MTRSEAADSQPGSAHQAMFQQSQARILRARRREATRRRQPWGHELLIARHDARRDARGPHRRARAPGIAVKAPRSCMASAANGSVSTAGRPTITMDARSGAASRLARYASRNRRRARLRWTAFLSCRLTANPARVGPGVSRHSTMRAGRLIRLPRWKSA